MVSKETYYRKKRLEALERILILTVKLTQLKKKDIQKIPLDFLAKTELALKMYVLEENTTQRYMHQTYISPNDVDKPKRCLRKS